MRTYKRPFYTIVGYSFLCLIISSLIFLPWTMDYLQNILNRQILFLVLTYILAFGIFLLFFFFFFSEVYTITNHEIIIKKRKLFTTKKILIFYNPKNISFFLKSNFLSNFFYYNKVKIYDENGQCLLSLLMRKDETKGLIDSSIMIGNDKTYFVKNKDFIYNHRNVLSIFISYFFVFLFIYLLSALVLNIFHVTIIQIKGKFYYANLLFLLFALFLYLISVLFVLLHTSNTKVQTGNNYLFFERGRLFKKRCIVPKFMLKNFVLRSNIFSPLFDTYSVDIYLGKKARIQIPIRRENMKFFFPFEVQELKKKKGSFKWIYFLIIFILGSLVTYFLSLFRLSLGIANAVIILLIDLGINVFSYSFVFNQRIFIRNVFFTSSYTSIDVHEIDKAKIILLPFNYVYFYFYIHNRRTGVIASKKEADNIKQAIGFFKEK